MQQKLSTTHAYMLLICSMNACHLSLSEHCGLSKKCYIPKVTFARGYERENEVAEFLAPKVFIL